MARGRLVLGALLAAAAWPAAPQVQGLAATVNGKPITNQRLEHFFEEYATEKGRPPATIWQPGPFKKLKREALDQLIEQEVLYQEAEKRRLSATPADADRAVVVLKEQFKKPGSFQRKLERTGFTEETYREFVRRQLSIRRLLDSEVAAARPAVSDDEVRVYYHEHTDLFVEPEAVRVRHILLSAPPDAPAAERKKARRAAEEVRALARKKGTDFGALAQRRSKDPTSASGGDLGFVVRGQMVRPFEDAAFALRQGEISPVVETVFGFHVIKLEERRAAVQVTEEQAREQIRKKLFGEKVETLLKARIAALRAAARVEILINL